MPAHQKLRAPVRAGVGSFALAQQRMTRQVDALFRIQGAGAMNIIPRHRHLTEIMRHGRHPKGQTIARAQAKKFRSLIGNGCDARRVRIRIGLELIGCQRELAQRFQQLKPLLFKGGSGWHLYFFRLESSRWASSFFGSAAKARCNSPSARLRRPSAR